MRTTSLSNLFGEPPTAHWPKKIGRLIVLNEAAGIWIDSNITTGEKTNRRQYFLQKLVPTIIIIIHNQPKGPAAPERKADMLEKRALCVTMAVQDELEKLLEQLVAELPPERFDDLISFVHGVKPKQLGRALQQVIQNVLDQKIPQPNLPTPIKSRRYAPKPAPR